MNSEGALKALALVAGVAIAAGAGLVLFGAACALILSGRVRDEEEEILAAEIAKRDAGPRVPVRPYIREHVVEYGEVSKADIVSVLAREEERKHVVVG